MILLSEYNLSKDILPVFLVYTVNPDTGVEQERPDLEQFLVQPQEVEVRNTQVQLNILLAFLALFVLPFSGVVPNPSADNAGESTEASQAEVGGEKVRGRAHQHDRLRMEV